MAGIVTDCFFIRARNDVLGEAFSAWGEKKTREGNLFMEELNEKH
jgi:hypothetical protein